MIASGFSRFEDEIDAHFQGFSVHLIRRLLIHGELETVKVARAEGHLAEGCLPEVLTKVV